MLKIENRADIFHYRTLYSILFFCITILILRYFQIQVIDFNTHYSKSEVNRVKPRTTYAPRGLILDRDGKILVENFPTYILTVTPYEMKNQDEQFLKISQIINIPVNELEKRFKKYNRGRFLPTIIAKNLTFEEIVKIEEMRLDFPGFQYERFDERLYDSKSKNDHFLGYLREIDKEYIKNLDSEKIYRAGELVGWEGLEKQYENDLRYSKGIEYIEVDTYGREINNLTLENKLAYPGKNLNLTIDSELQDFSRELLGDKPGVIITSNVRTGEILSMVSNPSYDLNIFRGETDSDEWKSIISDKNNPLLNRSISGLYPGGSQLKVITVLNLLEQKKINPEDELLCAGSYSPPGSSLVFNCWKEEGHGVVNLFSAIAQSCNVYFYETVQLLNLDSWVKTARDFGFNDLTKIDLPNEKIGLIPDSKFFTNTYGRWGWSERGVLLNMTLGQGDIQITPIQALKFINIIALSGKDVPILKLNKDKSNSFYTDLGITNDSWRILKNALYDVVNKNSGTGWRAKVEDSSLQSFGKTSTAENSQGEPHAWYIGYFVKNDEIYSLVVLVENGGGGGAVAAPIAGEIIKKIVYNKNLMVSSNAE
jgi:penicillin-binding protein 2